MTEIADSQHALVFAPDIGTAARAARTHWRTIVGSGLAAVFLALLWLWGATPEYEAEMVVGPAVTLADAAGTGTGRSDRTRYLPMMFLGESEADPVPNFTRFVELLTSVEVARDLAGDATVMTGLFPGQWDAAAAAWREPVDPVSRLRRWLRGQFGGPAWRPPGPEDVAQQLHRRVTIDQVAGTAMRRVSVRHADRAFAAMLLGRLVELADATLRAAAAARTEAAVRHLQAMLMTVRQPDHREVLIDLLAQQERARMMVAIELPFAADFVERPWATRDPVWPDPALVLSVAFLAGLTLSAFVVDRRQVRRG
jgi:uncharacterized protein involved in exopolysaccharide biosynthesis